jgi:hypothetical protein
MTGGAEGRRPIRIANVSGFYGDRLAAMGDMLAGPDPIDVLTGDYLAELTMLILWKARRKDPTAGFAATFLRQMEENLGTCLDRGVRVVANAGGLDPLGLAERLHAVADDLGLSPRIAVITGDDVLEQLPALQAAGHALAHLDTGQSLADAGVEPVTANVYLGGFGIATALAADADVVVTGRVTDAALVIGPAAWWHDWAPHDLDALAGAVVAGHVIECGTQATGGNYSFADEEIPDLRYPGFPIAEVAADGSSVITKQPGTGGAVSVGTVTAQLLYEIAEPAYANPDVVARFETIDLTQDGPDRVRISGVRGELPSGQVKVALNYPGGWRNTMAMVLTGLDQDAKAARATALLGEVLGGWDRFDAVDIRRVGSELRVTVKGADRVTVGRSFSNAVMELLLASYAGAYTTTPPTDATEYGVYWPTLIPADAVTHTVVLPDGTRVTVPPSPAGSATTVDRSATVEPRPVDGPDIHGHTEAAPLGAACGGRSGDKGGNANVGLWTRTDEAYRWLAAYLSVDRFRALLPEAADLEVRRYELPNLRALNFVVVGLLGEGVASSTRPDPQAKGLAEHVRAQVVDIPVTLLVGRDGPW